MFRRGSAGLEAVVSKTGPACVERRLACTFVLQPPELRVDRDWQARFGFRCSLNAEPMPSCLHASCHLPVLPVPSFRLSLRQELASVRAHRNRIVNVAELAGATSQMNSRHGIARFES